MGIIVPPCLGLVSHSIGIKHNKLCKRNMYLDYYNNICILMARSKHVHRSEHPGKELRNKIDILNPAYATNINGNNTIKAYYQ